jgi:hypothetical protein
MPHGDLQVYLEGALNIKNSAFIGTHLTPLYPISKPRAPLPSPAITTSLAGPYSLRNLKQANFITELAH